MKTITTIAILLLAGAAYATGGGGDPDPNQEQDQHQGQGQGQHQGQDQGQLQGQHQGQEAFGGDASANMEGVDVQNNTQFSSESTNTNVVLVPNNNTEPCLRVIGISFGNSSGAGGIGWPYRSSKCDFEQAADDAFAAGERDIGWFWKCQNPNLHKRFKGKDEDRMKAAADCLEVMQKGVTQTDMIRELKEQLTALESLREDDMIEYQRKLAGQKERCNETSNRIAETCRNSK